jgi:transcriptional regulator with XRE-family HTH domain
MSTPLGDYLRSRREATTPAAVGLPTGERRRTRGLRRSEVAALAGISVEYLVRIEQGRDRNPSVSVINALAGALRLDAADRKHLLDVAKCSSGTCGTAGQSPSRDVRPAVQAVLAQIEPGIAYVTNRLGEILAYTDSFEVLARPLGLLEAEYPNLARFVFTDRRARQAFPEWDRIADELAFPLSFGAPSQRSDKLIADLTAAAGLEFTRRLRTNGLPRSPRQVWCHPTVDDLHFDREQLELSAADAQQLVVLLPADHATENAVNRLRRSGGLALVK